VPGVAGSGKRCRDGVAGAVLGAVIAGTAIFSSLCGGARNGAAAVCKEVIVETNEKKERHVVWLTPQTVVRLDAANILANGRSRSEFVNRAVNFYAGYLATQDNTDFFAAAIQQTVSGVIALTENRLARLQFKEAVELAKLSHMLAAVSDVDEETLRRLHGRCVEEVKRIGGVVRFEDAVKFQRE
jgi:hypothetical protein